MASSCTSRLGILDGKKANSIKAFVIRPEGFSISKSAELIHGISQRRALTEGVDVKEVLGLLGLDLMKAKKVVAHNLRFDLGVLKGEAIRGGISLAQPASLECTSSMGRDFLSKRGKNKNEFFPRLIDLHKELFGIGFAPYHDALSDVSACSRVYFRLKELGF